MNKIIQLLCLISLFGGTAQAMRLNVSLFGDATQVIKPGSEYEDLNNDLLNAAGCGNLSRVKTLIGAGANANTRDSVGWTPLMYAACHGHTNICTYLVSNKADINARKGSACTALVLAGCNGHRETSEYLMDELLKPIKQDLDAATALLGIKKHHRALCLRATDPNLVQIIARQAFESRKRDLFAQINAITNADIKQFLLDHVKLQLHSHEHTDHNTSGDITIKKQYLDPISGN